MSESSRKPTPLHRIVRKAQRVKAAQTHNVRVAVDRRRRTKLKRQYAQSDFVGVPIIKHPKARLAVVIHLYYTENWELFNQALGNIDEAFDIYITLPAKNRDFKLQIAADRPQAHVFMTPNIGRDVLPFLQVMARIEDQGYEAVLKLHSKKSTHRVDGSEWLEDMVYKLLPPEQGAMDEILNALQKPQTGIVGPSGHYVSLVVNFLPNKAGMAHVLTRIYSARKSQQTLANKQSYGFFAGTMFWARIDALEPILNEGFNVDHFEYERGQIDATFAHSLERLFCLVPELEGRELYEASRQGAKQINHQTEHVPDWSDVLVDSE